MKNREKKGKKELVSVGEGKRSRNAFSRKDRKIFIHSFRRSKSWMRTIVNIKQQWNFRWIPLKTKWGRLTWNQHGELKLLVFMNALPQTLSNSSLPSPQSLSLSHFHCARIQRPFMQVNWPGWQRVPLSGIQCLFSARYQRPSDGHWHSAPLGPNKIKMNRTIYAVSWRFQLLHEKSEMTVENCLYLVYRCGCSLH